MKWRRELPAPVSTPVDRYRIIVTYAAGGTFTLNIGGPQSWDPEGHDPAHLTGYVADGLRRGGYDVTVQEERTVIT